MHSSGMRTARFGEISTYPQEADPVSLEVDPLSLEAEPRNPWRQTTYVNRMTDRHLENITFPELRLRAVMMEWNLL